MTTKEIDATRDKLDRAEQHLEKSEYAEAERLFNEKPAGPQEGGMPLYPRRLFPRDRALRRGAHSFPQSPYRSRSRIESWIASQSVDWNSVGASLSR